MASKNLAGAIQIEAAIALCMTYEGLRLKPYICPAGVPTLGFGATFYEDGRKVQMSDQPITKDRAVELLVWHMKEVFLPGVLRQCPDLLPLALRTNDWGKLNAILDFAFNTGVGRLQTSTLRRKINAQDWEGAKEELMKWTRGGGKVLPGLVKRRAAEAALMG